MTQITALRRAYKNSGSCTDTQCIRIELRDGAVLRYTDNQTDLTTSLFNSNGTEVPIPSVTYSSLLPFDLSAVGVNAEAAAEVDLEGVLGPLGYTREQIAQGVFEDARIYVFLTNYERPVEDEERLFTGFWGESTIIDGRYITKFTSLVSIFEVDTSRIVSQFCDATLGGPRCGVQMTAGSRLTSVSGNLGFDPMTSLSVKPFYNYDFSDEDTVIKSATGFKSINSVGAEVGKYSQVNTSLEPLISDINGVQAADFSAADAQLNQVGTNYSISSNGSYNDIFIVSENANGTPGIGFFDRAGTNNYALSPVSVDGGSQTVNEISNVLIPTQPIRIYESDVDTEIFTTGELHAYLQGQSTLLFNVPYTSNFEFTRIIGLSEVNNGVTYSAGKIGQILIYPQLRDEDRRKVINYLNSKWNITTNLLLGNDEANQRDARKRRVSKDDVNAPFTWFEALNTGFLSATGNFTPTPLGDTFTDNEVQWLAVPARVINVTAVVDSGQNSIVTINEELPADFTDIYENGSLQFNTGPNAGTRFTIISNTLNTFTLNVGTLAATAAGDEIQITIACDKDVDSCKSDFRNTVNFQGFGDLPTASNVFKIGDKQ